MRRVLAALLVGVFVVGAGLVGTLALGGGDDPSVSVTTFEPRIEANGLSVSEAFGDGAGTQSCVSSVPAPGSWQLSGSIEVERVDGHIGTDQTLSWSLTAENETELDDGTFALGDVDSNRIQLFASGRLNDTLEPGSTVPLTVTVTGDDGTLATETRSVDVINRSEPPCQNGRVDTP